MLRGGEEAEGILDLRVGRANQRPRIETFKLLKLKVPEGFRNGLAQRHCTWHHSEGPIDKKDTHFWFTQLCLQAVNNSNYVYLLSPSPALSLEVSPKYLGTSSLIQPQQAGYPQLLRLPNLNVVDDPLSLRSTHTTHVLF